MTNERVKRAAKYKRNIVLVLLATDPAFPNTVIIK